MPGSTEPARQLHPVASRINRLMIPPPGLEPASLVVVALRPCQGGVPEHRHDVGDVLGVMGRDRGRSSVAKEVRRHGDTEGGSPMPANTMRYAPATEGRSAARNPQAAAGQQDGSVWGQMALTKERQVDREDRL
jgi:hypothetical protein